MTTECAEGVCNSLLARADDVDLALPQTYMNRSGYAARCLVDTYGYDTSGVLVVYDEVALPFGRLRFRTGGSPAGHRGIESVIESLRTDRVARLRVGIAPPEDDTPQDLARFVLDDFTTAEEDALGELVGRAADACDCWLSEGPEVTMNRFNRST